MIVNGEIITGTDVDQRVALVINASGGKIGDEEKQRLKMQVLRNLMDETLQIQEAKAQKVEVEDTEVEQTYARIASQNFNQDAKAMDAYLTKIGSSAASLKRQIRGELSWQRLMRRNIQPFVNVSNDEVRDVIKRMNEAKGSEEFRVGEIFLSATDETRAAVLQNAQKIVDQLKNGGSFVGYARQFSEASTASVGGDLGWIKRGVLPTELDGLLPTLQTGQLVGPVEVRGGYSILLLIDKRQVLTADPRDALLSLKQISISFPPGVTEAQATAKAKAFADAMKAARGCGTVDEVAKGQGAEVVTNDQIKARDLPAPKGASPVDDPERDFITRNDKGSTAAAYQDRIGPNRVGPLGLLQSLGSRARSSAGPLTRVLAWWWRWTIYGVAGRGRRCSGRGHSLRNPTTSHIVLQCPCQDIPQRNRTFVQQLRLNF